MKEFVKRCLAGMAYLLLWVGYFVLSRIVFLIYYYGLTNELSTSTILALCVQGLKLDLSMAAYLSVIPFLILALSIKVSGKNVGLILKLFTFPLVFIIQFLMMFDLGLYGAWGIRLDTTPFIYLDTPKEMFASVAAPILILGIIVWIISSSFFIYVFNRLIDRFFAKLHVVDFRFTPLLLVYTSLLVILMRGGLQTIPINQSSVYIFDNMFANHAAINFAWNFSHSIKSKNYSAENPFVRLDSAAAIKVVNDARDSLNYLPESSRMHKILKDSSSNIILIIWESLTAKIVGPLGGEPDVTLHLNELMGEGVSFDRFYANGDRSDKGLVAIFSGYYPQPDKSIMKIPAKSRSLPMFTHRLAKLGYNNSFYYGGDLNFGNMNTYFRQGGVSDLIDEHEFAAADQNSKWGAHDHVVFERLKDDLSGQIKEPFFKAIFTLSSHEPFEFPGERKFGDDVEVNSFRSAHAYTDSVVGDFLRWSKEQKWWDHTLIIITADHGHKLPQHNGAFNEPSKYHIPMLWLGGALDTSQITVSNICSQKDLAYTLLKLLNGDITDFDWSHDMLQESSNHFAHYIYNKGFGTIDQAGFVVYDFVSDKIISQEGAQEDDLTNLGQSITQTAFQDFLGR